MDFLTKLQVAREKGEITEKLHVIFTDLYTSYKQSVDPAVTSQQEVERVFDLFLQKVKEELANPFSFQPFHKQITAPFDYYALGVDFGRPLVDLKRSTIFGLENLDKSEREIQAGGNVVFFANHQTEVDPQVISVMLEKSHPRIGKEMIFVAGDRVITDPLAIPFSMGRNLLCIYSKRHIANPPEKKVEKQLHNQRTMRIMKELLSEGEKCIYVAPSGGRDRKNPQTGEVKVSPFDPNNIEMFRLMAMQADKPTHFYPLALTTYNILPPPLEIESAIGEMRSATRDNVCLSFGEEINFDLLDQDIKDKHARRIAVAHSLWSQLSNDYEKILQRKASL